MDHFRGSGHPCDPAWIIPVVGLLDVPTRAAGARLPNLHGLIVFALAIGLFFAVPLFTLIFSRLVFEPVERSSVRHRYQRLIHIDQRPSVTLPR
jgi:hypothetical protein